MQSKFLNSLFFEKFVAELQNYTTNNGKPVRKFTILREILLFLTPFEEEQLPPL